jgi:hypothetical protein
MRFSTYLLTAGLSALALSAPVDRDRDDECEWDPGEVLSYTFPASNLQNIRATEETTRINTFKQHSLLFHRANTYLITHHYIISNTFDFLFRC